MRSQRAFVMVQALVVVAGLVALMTLIATNERVTLNNIQNQLRQRRAEAAARSAIAMAQATLQEVNTNLVAKTDDWNTLGDYGNTEYTVGDSTFRLEIVDAGSRANVNTITEAQLQSLPLTQEQLDSLLDWREATLTPRPSGAKDEYYNNLPEPYNAKLGRITTLNELLLVRGWTARDLYQPPSENTITTAVIPQDEQGNPLPLAEILTAESGMPNTRTDGQPRVNIGTGNLNVQALIQLGVPANLAQSLSQSGPYPTWSELLRQPGMTNQAAQIFLDEVTVVPSNRLEGKLNINTASQGVLESALGLPQDAASGIVSRQDSGFTSLGDLTTVPGITTAQLAQIADSIGVGSDTFIVRAYGQSGGVGVAIEAVVGIRNEQAQIITFERLNNPDIPSWWRWEPDATSTVDMGVTSEQQ